MNDFLNAISGTEWPMSVDPRTVIFIIVLAFALGLCIGFVYMWTHDSISYSRTFVSALAMLPMLVALILLSMTGNLFAAFGMLGVFGVVRFRNVLKDTRDTGFVLWAIMEGISLGTTRFSIALIGAVGVGAAFLCLSLMSFGLRHRYDAVLTVRVTGDVPSRIKALKEFLERHAKRIYLASERRSTPQGTDVSYRLLLRDARRFAELQSELTSVEGLENVSVYLHEDEAEI
jgi:hypothetical protein